MLTKVFRPERHPPRVDGNGPSGAALRAGCESHGRPGRHIIMEEERKAGMEKEEKVLVTATDRSFLYVIRCSSRNAIIPREQCMGFRVALQGGRNRGARSARHQSS